MCELLQSPQLVLLLLPQKHQCFCSYDVHLAYAVFTLPQSECRIFDGWSFSPKEWVFSSTWETVSGENRRTQTLFGGERCPKTSWNLVLWRSGKTREIRCLQRRRNSQTHGSCKSWNQWGSCVEWQIHINAPKMLNLELTITLPWFSFSYSCPFFQSETADPFVSPKSFLLLYVCSPITLP